MPYENDVNTALYRPVQLGKKFEKLIPRPSGEKTFLGSGDTSFSIKKMAEMVKQHSGQMKQVAEVLQTDSLNETLANIKDFIFNHFQYKADTDDQLLRSPGYAWHYDRFSGIDCKSYSILASSLLTELGILHYIRRIKQPGYFPTEFTHVYVVVPEDQKNGNLKQGYYVIDGTLADDFEPPFVEKDDLFMKHYALNAPGMGLSIGSFSLSNLSSIKNLIASIDCWGGSAYTANELNANIAAINTYYNQLILDINKAVVDDDFEKFSLLINEFFGNSKVYVTGAEKVLAEGWNSCTSARIKVNIKAWKFYRDTVGAALTAWLNDNFIKYNSEPPVTIRWANDVGNANYGFQFMYSGNLVVVNEPLYYYEPKPKTINQFAITPYVQDVQNNNLAFNPLTFISGLSTVLASFEPNTPGTTVQNPSNPNTTLPNQPANTSGGGWLGWVVGIAALGFFMNGFASTPSKSGTATRRTSTSKTKRNVSRK